MIGRYGASESYVTSEAIAIEMGIKKRIKKESLFGLYRNAGVFPYGKEMAYRFGMLMKEISVEADILAVHKAPMSNYLVDNICRKDIILTSLPNIEPYYFDKPWTSSLKGKRVLVIHPFEKTIWSQYQRREKLFANPDILPEFELRTLKAVQTIAGEKDDRFQDWVEALYFMRDKALSIDFDVAILGCGAYGFPLAALLKRAGKQAIHLGGATQILFGIKGGRWDTHPVISKLYNEYWVRPDTSEVPRKAKDIENACYW